MNRHGNRTPRRRRRRAAGGVTFVELVLVLLMLSILATAAVPRFADSLSRHRVESAAKRIAHDLRLARRRAIAQSASQTVAFNSPSAYQYELLNMDDPRRPGEPYIVDISAEPYRTALVSVDFGGSATIVFDGHGQPSSAGTVTVQSGARQRTVQVIGESGKVEVL